MLNISIKNKLKVNYIIIVRNNIMPIDFKSLNLPISQKIAVLSEETQQLIFNYLKDLSETEKICYKIAYEHLGSSFDIVRSNGYSDWLKKNNV
jgi:hypothetical protein